MGSWIRQADTLNSGILLLGEGSVSQTICATRPGPVIRDENGVGADRFDHHCADCKIARGAWSL